MKKIEHLKILFRGSIVLFLLAFIFLTSCHKSSPININSGGDTTIIVDTTINKMDTIINLIDTTINQVDTTIIDTTIVVKDTTINYQDLLSLKVKYNDNKLPSKLNIGNTTGNLDFDINISGNNQPEVWEYFKSNAPWLHQTDSSSTQLKLSYDANQVGKRMAYVLFRLKDYPGKFALVKIVQAEVDVPEADLLDIVFNNDGTAEDISPMDMTVKRIDGTNDFTTTHNDIYDLNVVNFDPSTPGIQQDFGDASYYRIDYGSNSDFQNKVADGFSMEALAKVDYDFFSNPVGPETKIFGSIYGGGYSLMIRTVNGSNNWAFQINLDGYRYYNGMTPKSNQWYHLVGVWDKDAGWVYFYVNGSIVAQSKITKSFDAVSNTNMQWIAIGGNGGSGNGGTDLNNSFKGSIGIVRMYADPLSGNEVKALWSRVDK